MDIKRQAIEEIKRQINEGRFKSNNELVLAIRDLYNNAKATASTNPLLAEFLSEYDYTRFTKDVTAELVECYKKHKEEMEKTTNLSDIKVGDEAIDQNLISQVNTDSGTYYTVKDGTETKVFTGDDSTLATVQSTLEAMEIGPLLSIFLQTIIVRFLIYILSALIFVIVYARMIEIYLMVSLAPIPFSTFGNREQSMIGQNYLRSLFALGFQGFLIMVCVGIYAVLIQSVAFSTDIIGSLWGVLGYTILLAFTLFKTGAVAKSILHAH